MEHMLSEFLYVNLLSLWHCFPAVSGVPVQEMVGLAWDPCVFSEIGSVCLQIQAAILESALQVKVIVSPSSTTLSRGSIFEGFVLQLVKEALLTRPPLMEAIRAKKMTQVFIIFQYGVGLVTQTNWITVWVWPYLISGRCVLAPFLRRYFALEQGVSSEELIFTFIEMWRKCFFRKNLRSLRTNIECQMDL